MRAVRNKDATPTAAIRRRREQLSLRDGYLGLLLRVVLLAGVGWLLLTQVFLVTQARGNGMFPAVKDGDLIIAFRLQRDYAKNDVVACRVDGQRRFGRIAAMGGDTVFIDEGGVLFVNGAAQQGEIMYPTYPVEEGGTQLTVPEHSVYLLGDFRTQCEDSRHFGAVPLAEIEGKVITLLRRRGL